jgi:vancomycin permeability regulator SanA
MMSGLFRFLSRLLVFLVLVFVLTAAYVVYDGLQDSGDTADCAVVLGAAIKPDGQPSGVLRGRLDRAVSLYRDKKVPVIIVSGADHTEDARYQEAGSMARYLESQQVPENAIIEDHGGTSTDATAHDLVGIMDSHQFKSVMIVTSYYHMLRTKMAVKRAGITHFMTAHSGTVNQDDAFNIVREVIDIFYHLYNYYLGPATQQAVAAAQSAAQKLNSQIKSSTKHVEDEGDKVEKDAAGTTNQP